MLDNIRRPLHGEGLNEDPIGSDDAADQNDMSELDDLLARRGRGDVFAVIGPNRCGEQARGPEPAMVGASGFFVLVHPVVKECSSIG